MDHKVHHPVALAKFTVIPRKELDKAVVEGNFSPSIKDRRVSATLKVTGDNSVLSIIQDALQVVLQCMLHHLLDVIVFGSFLQTADQIDLGC